MSESAKYSHRHTHIFDTVSSRQRKLISKLAVLIIGPHTNIYVGMHVMFSACKHCWSVESMPVDTFGLSNCGDTFLRHRCSTSEWLSGRLVAVGSLGTL